MNSKSYTLEGIGEILVVKHSQARKLTLRLKPGQPPKVVIPRLMSFDMGYAFAVEKRQWITEHLPQLEKISQQMAFDEQHEFKSRMATVRFKLCETRCVQAIKVEDGFELRFPMSTDFNDARVQRQIRLFLTEMLRSEAVAYLPDRVEKLANECGFRYRHVSVKNVHTRWGSCSAQDNINLNIHLMRLPEHLSDFVILHELCHTVHKNHGAGFHDLLDKLVCGREKELDKELNKYKIQF